MSNALLYARLLTNQATDKPTEPTKAPGEGEHCQLNSKTAPRANLSPIRGNEQLKLDYNRLLAREAKAEAYLSSPNRTQEEIDKWLPEFNKLCMELGSILDQLQTFTHKEAVNGFIINGLDSIELKQHDSKTTRQEELQWQSR